MRANTFGHMFALTGAGESHGKAYVGILDGMPAGFNLSEPDIQPFLDARRPGADATTSQRKEIDKLEFLSGLFQGKTTGAPIAFIIRNNDQRSSDYDDYEKVFRPGHADFTYQQKYGIRDHRGGGRASARETCLRVVTGGIAELYLNQFDMRFTAQLIQMGDQVITSQEQIPPIIEKLRREKNALGAKVKVCAHNIPAGLGEPIFEKLDAQLAAAMMGIPAVKAVEVGSGVNACEQRGSEHRDAMTPEGFVTNHAGGILGGISSGQPIEVTVTFKPTSSIPQSVSTLDLDGNAVDVTVTGRHDPCVGIRGVPVVRAVMAHVMMDNFLSVHGRMTQPNQIFCSTRLKETHETI